METHTQTYTYTVHANTHKHSPKCIRPTHTQTTQTERKSYVLFVCVCVCFVTLVLHFRCPQLQTCFCQTCACKPKSGCSNCHLHNIYLISTLLWSSGWSSMCTRPGPWQVVRTQSLRAPGVWFGLQAHRGGVGCRWLGYLEPIKSSGAGVEVGRGPVEV